MNYTPLDIKKLTKKYKKFIAGPLIVFMFIIVVAILAALFYIFLNQVKS